MEVIAIVEDLYEVAGCYFEASLFDCQALVRPGFTPFVVDVSQACFKSALESRIEETYNNKSKSTVTTSVL